MKLPKLSAPKGPKLPARHGKTPLRMRKVKSAYPTGPLAFGALDPVHGAPGKNPLAD